MTNDIEIFRQPPGDEVAPVRLRFGLNNGGKEVVVCMWKIPEGGWGIYHIWDAAALDMIIPTLQKLRGLL